MNRTQRRIQLAHELRKGTRVQLGGHYYTISKKPKKNDFGEIVLKLRHWVKDRHAILLVMPRNTELTVLVPPKK